MEHLCEDEKLRENLQANAKRYADAFHWGRTANEILAVLKKTIENR
jgi:glycosyltransferase involved in cell wall biosynthesis